MFKFIKSLIYGKEIYVSRWIDGPENGYINLKFKEKLMLSAEQALIKTTKLKDEKRIKNREMIFNLIRLSMTKGATKTKIEVKYMDDNVELLEVLGYTVVDVVPVGNQHQRFLEDELGHQTNIPYHYYEVSWAPVENVPVANEA